MKRLFCLLTLASLATPALAEDPIYNGTNDEEMFELFELLKDDPDTSENEIEEWKKMMDEFNTLPAQIQREPKSWA